MIELQPTLADHEFDREDDPVQSPRSDLGPPRSSQSPSLRHTMRQECERAMRSVRFNKKSSEKNTYRLTRRYSEPSGAESTNNDEIRHQEFSDRAETDPDTLRDGCSRGAGKHGDVRANFVCNLENWQGECTCLARSGFCSLQDEGDIDHRTDGRSSPSVSQNRGKTIKFE